MNENKDPKRINLEVQMDEATSMGSYVNMAVIQHSASEFVMDFIFIAPGQPKAKVRSRLILTPDHAKRLLRVLGENVGHFEKRFGEIKLPEETHGGPASWPSTIQ